MICVSVGAGGVEECRAAVAGARMVEVRLDLIAVTTDDLAGLCAGPARILVSVRGEDAAQSHLASTALQAGAWGIDVELEAPPDMRDSLVREARGAGATVVVSHHDHHCTPGRAQLLGLVDRCFDAGADVAKIACHVANAAEAARLLSLLDDPRAIVPVGMGQAGAITRVVAPLLGSPITYAHPVGGPPTAPGQLDVGTLQRLLRTWETT